VNWFANARLKRKRRLAVAAAKMWREEREAMDLQKPEY
jgi:hypothetical protein